MSELVEMQFALELFMAFSEAKSVSDFCLRLVLGPLRPFGAMASGIATVQNDSSLLVIGTYGDWNREFLQMNSFVWDKGPIANAIRTNETARLELGEATSGLTDGDIGILGKGMAVIPFDLQSRVFGGLFLTFADYDKAKNLPAPYCDLIGTAAVIMAHRTKRISIAGLRTEPEDIQEVRFTDRELSVISLIGEEKTNAQIGFALKVSESTVKQDCIRIFKKLGVSSRSSAYLVAKELGLL